MYVAPNVMPLQEPDAPRTVSILGATGSIGENTLDLIGRNAQAFEVVALTAHKNAKQLAASAIKHKARLAVVADDSKYAELKEALSGTDIEAAAGEQALLEAVAHPADWYMAAIVGAAGLRPTFEAVQQGTCLALANKECLVAAGSVFMREVVAAKTALLPVDSEHSAAFQAIGDSPHNTIERIILTASGGPFRTWSVEEISKATPDQALKHPNWSMGAKITVDSATLMNKGLELIEAFHLFPVSAEKLDVLVHPQSIVHCLVEYTDGSFLAQLSCPDMRTPIAYSLAWPKRMPTPTKKLDLVSLGQLTFEAPDENRFPALRIAREVLRVGGTAGTVLNAANEVAVEAFLANRVGFSRIPEIVEKTLEKIDSTLGLGDADTLESVLEIDKAARRVASLSLGEEGKSTP